MRTVQSHLVILHAESELIVAMYGWANKNKVWSLLLHITRINNYQNGRWTLYSFAVRFIFVFQHERYGSGAGAYPNDIALLQFFSVTFNQNVKAITLATRDQAGNPDCWITGWGHTVGECVRLRTICFV